MEFKEMNFNLKKSEDVSKTLSKETLSNLEQNNIKKTNEVSIFNDTTENSINGAIDNGVTVKIADKLEQYNDYQLNELSIFNDTTENSINGVFDNGITNSLLETNGITKLQDIDSLILDNKKIDNLTTNDITDFNKSLDINGDGRITMDEIQAFLNAMDETQDDKDSGVNLSGQSDRTKQSRINDLTDKEKEVYSKFEEAIDGNPLELQDKALEYFSQLSDEELADFINAYQYVNEDNGGFADLFIDLLIGPLASGVMENSSSNHYMEADWYTNHENSEQIDRIINLLSDKDKSFIIRELCPGTTKPDYIKGSNQLERLLNEIFSGNFNPRRYPHYLISGGMNGGGAYYV